jgi:ribosome-binding protein aMBF1 (putative translation factor)
MRNPDQNKSHRNWADIKQARRAAMTAEERTQFEDRTVRLATALRVGMAIRDAREEAALTQTELAARMGVAQSALSRIEAGRANITVEMLTRIASALGAPLSVKLGAGEVPLAS